MRKHFRKFYVAQQKQMTQMDKILEKVNKELTEGKCSQEQRDNFQKYYDTVKANYERLAYVRHLLTLPPDFIQKIQFNRSKREYEKEQARLAKEANADQDAVLAENQEAIDNMTNLLAEVQNSEGEQVCQ